MERRCFFVRPVAVVATQCLVLCILATGNHNPILAQSSVGVPSTPPSTDAAKPPKNKPEKPAKSRGDTKPPAKKEKVGRRVLYACDAFTLSADAIVEGNREASAVSHQRSYLINDLREMIRPNLRGHHPILTTDNPLVDVLYQIALNDLEMNIVHDALGTYFRVSPDFPNAIFTRDVAYAAHLGLNLVMPQDVSSHLQLDRRLRRELGFRAPVGEEIPLSGIDQKTEAIGGYEFFERYGTNAYTRRTDDPVWVLGYWAAYCAQGNTKDIEWMVDEFRHFDQEFYRHFYDESDGLYRGQASFIDVGGTGYPSSYSIQDCVMIKALSTNALYVAAFDTMARACRLLGKTEWSNTYRQRAQKLRERIAIEFRHPEGYYAYFKDMDGDLQPRREQLGMAFSVLFDILPPAEWSRAIADYPANDFGSPTFYPFFGAKKVYHDQSIWPFANVYFRRAQLKQQDHDEGRQAVVSRTLGEMARHALWGNFSEVLDYETGGWRVKHARSYIWSAAAYLSVLYHQLAGIDISDGETVRLTPCLPESFGGRFQLEQLKIQEMTLDLSLSGHGTAIASFSIDGQVQPYAPLPIDDQHHRLEIKLQPATKP